MRFDTDFSKLAAALGFGAATLAVVLSALLYTLV